MDLISLLRMYRKADGRKAQGEAARQLLKAFQVDLALDDSKLTADHLELKFQARKRLHQFRQFIDQADDRYLPKVRRPKSKVFDYI